MDDLVLSHIREICRTQKKNPELKVSLEKVEHVIQMIERVKAVESLKVHRVEFDIVDWRFDMKTLLSNLN